MFNIELFLCALKTLNVSEVVGLSLFARWGQQRKELFWSSYEKARVHRKKAQIFWWLAGCMFRTLKYINQDEFVSVAKNLDGNASLSGDELLEYVIWKIAGRLHQIER
jgi:hypothetical protein